MLYLTRAFLLSMLSSPPPPPPAYWLLDHFNDVDGTLLENHAMDVGPGWIPVPPFPNSPQIVTQSSPLPSAVAQNTDPTFGNIEYCSDAGAADGILSAVVNCGGGGSVALSFRGVFNFGVLATYWIMVSTLEGTNPGLFFWYGDGRATGPSGPSQGVSPNTDYYLTLQLIGGDATATLYQSDSVTVVQQFVLDGLIGLTPGGTFFGLRGDTPGVSWRDFTFTPNP